MPDHPAAEIEVDESLVRTLLRTQATAIPDAAALPLAKLAEGWDNTIWRLGDEYVVRLPRRAMAAPLVLHEQTTLPGIARRIAPSGIAVPAPVVSGRPGTGYPWAWSVARWIDGEPGFRVPRAERAGWAGPLARALDALHVPAPAEHPVNAFRGVPLADRAGGVASRIASLRARNEVDARALDRLADLWAAGLGAPAHDGPALWIHGDLHPGNLVARGPALTGIIDFGDVTAGDPAYDLAIAWLAFDASGRAAFIAASGDRRDAATWVRAHAWAAAITLMFLDASDDNPEYLALGQDCLAELAA